MNCSKCSGSTEGWKCSVCGALSESHDENHACGGDKCQPKCEKCGEAQDNCKCG